MNPSLEFKQWECLNVSYSVIAKKLSCNKGWVSKWTRCWKKNPAESLQSQSRRQQTNKAALNLTAQRITRKNKYQRGQSLQKLKSILKWKQLSGSQESIRQFLHNKFKRRCFKRQKVPLLTAEYKKHTVNFAKKYKDMDSTQVTFTYESPFKLYHVPNSKNGVVWGSEEHLIPWAPQMKFSPTVLVWGGIAEEGANPLQ